MKKNSSFNRKIPKLAQVFGLLREQEEKDDAGAGDIFGDEPAGEDEEKKEEPSADKDEEKTDDVAGDKEDKEKKDSESDTKIKISAEERAEVEDSVSDEVDAFLQDAEHKSRAAAAIEAEKEKRRNESLKRVYRHLIRESAASDIDLQIFASEIARLIKNYSTLLDIEAIILNRAVSYIKNYYGEDTAKTLKNILDKEYRISVPKGPLEKDEPEIPIAVGARATSGE